MINKILSLSVLLFCIFGFSQSNRKVLFIGIDGCRSDVLMASNTPAIHNLVTNATYSLDGLCAYKTWSGNGWSSMLTGVWHTKHGVTDNTFSGSNYSNYSDFISRIENFNPSLRTITSVHWAPINNTIIQNADVENTFATDLAVKNAAVAAMNSDNPDLLFVAFDDVDHAGHLYGFTPTTSEYVAAIETTDSYVSEIIAAMQNRPNFANEDWLVVVTTDHGGNQAGHGGGTFEERVIFNIFSNPNFTQQQLQKTIITETETFNQATFSAGSYAQPTNQTPFSFGTSQDFTIELWVKPTAAFTADPSFISNKDWDSGYNPGFVICGQQGQFWKVNISDGVDRLDIQGGRLELNTWHHLAVTFDRDGLMTAYENGVPVGFDKMQAIGNINTVLPLIINQDGTTSYGPNFNGSYKDIRIWNTVLSNETLIEWANQPITSIHPFYSQLLVNWKCNEVLGNQLLDSSVNANSATTNGTVTRQEVTNSFTIQDFTNTTREPDNAVTALSWLCVPIESNWSLDGQSRVEICATLNNLTVDEENAIEINPNPVDTTISLTYHSKEKASQLMIASLFGQIIYQKLLNVETTDFTNQIDVSSLKSGVYFILIKNEKGIISEKFIKK